MSAIPVDHVKLGQRHRQDMGDLDALAESIRELGLLQPIVLDKDLHLIAGARRLEAVKRLGWALIDVRVVKGLDEALPALKAERDENTCRKDFSPTEAVAIAIEIEAAMKPLAEQRVREGAERGGMVRAAQLTGEALGPSAEARTVHTSEIAAAAVGMGRRTYDRAKQVVEAAEENPESMGDLPALMDATGNVLGTHREMKRRKAKQVASTIIGVTDKSRAAVLARRDRIRKLADEGHNAAQISNLIGIGERAVRDVAREHGIEILADKVLGNTRRLDSNRIIESMVGTVRGFGGPLLDHVDYDALDPDLFGEWIDSLANAIASLTKLKRKLTDTKESIRASA